MPSGCSMSVVEVGSEDGGDAPALGVLREQPIALGRWRSGPERHVAQRLPEHEAGGAGELVEHAGALERLVGAVQDRRRNAPATANATP
jgi:hypothetical protein